MEKTFSRLRFHVATFNIFLDDLCSPTRCCIPCANHKCEIIVHTWLTGSFRVPSRLHATNHPFVPRDDARARWIHSKIGNAVLATVDDGDFVRFCSWIWIWVRLRATDVNVRWCGIERKSSGALGLLGGGHSLAGKGLVLLIS